MTKEWANESGQVRRRVQCARLPARVSVLVLGLLACWIAQFPAARCLRAAPAQTGRSVSRPRAALLPPQFEDPQPDRPVRPGRPVAAEPPEQVPPQVREVLTAMAAHAGVIFVGQVRAIDREDAHGYVDISFAVQRALRGTSAAVYVLREWAGLWTWQQDRYQPGERLLLLLTPRSGSGFSSPVGGMDGAIPLLGGTPPPLRDVAGQVAPDTGAIPNAEFTNARADLRWIAARVVRSATVPPRRFGTTKAAVAEIGAAPAMAVDPAPGNGFNPPVGSGPVPPLGSGSAPSADGKPQQGVALSAVLALLDVAPKAVSDVP